MKRKQLSPGRFLVLINLTWFAIAAILLFANSWQFNDRVQKSATIDTIEAELRWQSHVTARARRQAKDLPELQFLVRAMETKDADIYAIAKAAWKWGKVYQVSPYLIMAVAHRESNFDPAARSYDKDGLELAMGAMQINYRVWEHELKLDLSMMENVDYNIQKGTIILKDYLDKYPGDVGAALFAYWGGQLAGGRYTYPVRVLESKYFDACLSGVAQ
jgi:soluble lytic murein transglycosylase-like protein